MRTHRFAPIAITSLFIAFVACSLDYSEAFLSEDLQEDIPDSILIRFTHTMVRSGAPVFRISADRAEIYGKKEQNRLQGVRFQEFGRNGEIITEGTADRAVFFTATEDAEMEGMLEFYSVREKASFATDFLYWNNAEKLLSGREDTYLFIKKDSGTEIRGVGFEVEVATRSVAFSGPVAGTFVAEEDEDAPAN